MDTEQSVIVKMLEENRLRNDAIQAIFQPQTGEGCLHHRTPVHIDDYLPRDVYLPDRMLEIPLVSGIVECGSVKGYAQRRGLTHMEALEQLEL